MLFISPYIIGSESARNIARTLGIKQIKGHKIMPRNTLIVNWGKTELAPRHRGRIQVLNNPNAVARAKNKILTFQALRAAGVSIPEFTTNRTEAMRWLNEDQVLYGRHSVTGQQGQGISIIKADSDSFPHCPLYTKGIAKAFEFRVHVFGGKAISYAQKKRRNDTEANAFIKNSNNGWVFCQEGVVLPDCVRDESIKAVRALGLDFGAVDILMKRDVPYVLEVNTAPGIEGRTLVAYTNAIKESYETFNWR